jgi:hypothetical protein
VRWAEAGALVAIVFAGAVYVTLIAIQDEPVEAVTWIVAGSVVAAAATAAAGIVADGRGVRVALFGWTGLTALVWTILGAASVGIAFAPAAVLSGVSIRRAQRRD